MTFPEAQKLIADQFKLRLLRDRCGGFRVATESSSRKAPIRLAHTIDEALQKAEELAIFIGR